MHVSRNASLLLGGGTSLTYLLGSVLPLFLIDRFGRRTLLMVSSAGQTMCFSLAAILLSCNTLRTACGAVAMVFIFQLFLGVGWLPVPWLYPSEINTTRLRSRGAAIASGFNWMSVFAIVKITPIAIGKWTPKLYTCHSTVPCTVAAFLSKPSRTSFSLHIPTTLTLSSVIQQKT